MGNSSFGQPEQPQRSRDMTRRSAIAYVQKEVDRWVTSTLKQWKAPRRIGNGKTFHDPVHGLVKLEPHEVAIVDMPIIQRLRHIGQAGLARYIYPTMQHSRLEHSLGVLNIVQRVLDSLSEQQPVSPLIRVYVRLAALLHDVGTLPFSHLGEILVEEQFPELLPHIQREAYQGEPRFFAGNTLREVLSYLVVTCPAFKKAVYSYIDAVGSASDVKLLSAVDLDKVGRLILGKHTPDEERWPVAIVNGPFDADQIDYIIRDSYHSGIKLNVDVERMLQGLRVVSGGGWDRALSFSSNSVIYLEAFMFAKINLYFQAYSHYKLRALECMVRGAFEQATDLGTAMPSSIGDWLNTDEHDLVPGGSKFGQRGLLKRCVVLDRTTVEQESLYQLSKLVSDSHDTRMLRRLRQIMYKSLPDSARTTLADLWIDSPPLPDIHIEAMQCPIWITPERVVALNDMFPIAELLRSHTASMTRVDVFYSDDPTARQLVANTAAKIFSEAYGIHLRPLALAIALHDLAHSV